MKCAGDAALAATKGAREILANFKGKDERKDPPSHTEDGAPAEKREDGARVRREEDAGLHHLIGKDGKKDPPLILAGFK